MTTDSDIDIAARASRTRERGPTRTARGTLCATRGYASRKWRFYADDSTARWTIPLRRSIMRRCCYLPEKRGIRSTKLLVTDPLSSLCFYCMYVYMYTCICTYAYYNAFLASIKREINSATQNKYINLYSTRASRVNLQNYKIKNSLSNLYNCSFSLFFQVLISL